MAAILTIALVPVLLEHDGGNPEGRPNRAYTIVPAREVDTDRVRDGRDQAGPGDDHRQAHEVRSYQDHLSTDAVACKEPLEDFLAATFRVDGGVLELQECLSSKASREDGMAGAHDAAKMMKEQALLHEALPM